MPETCNTAERKISKFTPQHPTYIDIYGEFSEYQIVMHFRDEQQEREHQVTQALVNPGPLHRELVRALGINSRYWVEAEFNKKAYKRIGDVDLAFSINPNTRWEQIYAIEIKVMQLRSDGTFQSEKRNKHEKQLTQLQKEGWHRIFLLDVIITQPAQGWCHPQAEEGLKQFTKEVQNEIAGHIVMQINAVAHKSETEAGSVNCELLKESCFQRSSGEYRRNIIQALRAVRQNAYKAMNYTPCFRRTLAPPTGLSQR